MMAATTGEKFQLRTLHEEIGFFDRKLAHALKFEKFASENAREDAARKLRVKREALVQNARRLMENGVEFKPGDVPRSMRPEGEKDIPAPVVPAVETTTVVVEEAASPVTAGSYRGPYAGTALDWQASVRAYMEKKGKA